METLTLSPLESSTSTCDYRRLFNAMNTVLRVLSTPGHEREPLFRSFEEAANGLSAERALLLLVEKQEPPHFRALAVRGLTEKDVHACERGERVDGLDMSIVRAAIATRQLQMVGQFGVDTRDAAPHPADRQGSVFCAPIIDSLRDEAMVVLYFQHARCAADGAYGEREAVWLDGYSAAIGQAFAYYFQQLRGKYSLSDLVRGTPLAEHAPELIGDSSQTEALRRVLHETYVPAACAPDPDPILILGEKGTGKDLVARYLYGHSARRTRPFVVVNCAEISDELATARFFGHKKGSFTGAMSDETGFFRAAHRGVVFLDEIGELTPRAQGTLLRVLENRTVVPIGETREVRVDVQVVLATNRDPETAVASGAIRGDLFDRFKTQVVRIEPLRERPSDILALARHFLAHHQQRTGKKTLGFEPDTMRKMIAYSWPGNVREVARVCSLLVTHAKPGQRIDEHLLARCCPDIGRRNWNPKAVPVLLGEVPMRKALRAFGRELILARLERYNWDVRSARKSLGLPKTTFHRYAMGLGITTSGQNRNMNGDPRDPAPDLSESP
jgi:DNA-binding NtrC family response regulator